MRSSRIELSRSIFLEHLEEASFLYEQRLRIIDDPAVSRTDIGELEERLDAHIDGLATGGEQSLILCMNSANAGDSGELHAAVSLFCRQARWGMILRVLEGLDPEDVERMQAVSDALNNEMPGHWSDELVRMIPVCRPKEVPISARLAGYRRLPAGAELLTVLSGKAPHVPEAEACILWALGRLRFQEARGLMAERYLAGRDELSCIHAALALLRMGEPEALHHCERSAASQDWPYILIGISGGRSAVPLMSGRAVPGKASANCLLGLGLLGDISAVETLLARLSDPDTADASALALNLITGAEMYEQAFIPEEIGEDELFPEELEKFRKGELPVRPDGEPFGVVVTRLSQNPEDWRDWWSKNRSGFNPGIRYRNGRPFSPACLLENMEYEMTPFKIRRLAYEELVIRYGVDFPFEADMYVSRQKSVLEDMARWARSAAGRFREGEWYFAGRPTAP